MTPPPDPETKQPLGRRIEAIVLIPNLILVAVVILCLIATQAGPNGRVTPLVQGEKTTESRILQLERQLSREPGNMGSAIELARLYQRVGEFPWSYNALRAAERKGSHAPRWRLTLGLAYLDLGKNKDALRVMTRTLKECGQHPVAAGAGASSLPTSPPGGPCDANIRVKLEIFTQLARVFEQRGIDSRRHYGAAEKALREILKPVEVDPDKMRPKAPAEPETPVEDNTSG